MVLAPPAVHKRVVELLKAFDEAPLEGEKVVRKRRKILYTNAGAVVGILNQYFPSARYPVTISGDPTNTIVIVEAPTSLQKKIFALIDELDVDPKRDLVQKDYVTENLSVPEALTLLRSALQGPPNTTLTLGPQKDKIVVLAPPAVHKRVVELLKTFDAAPLEGEEIVRRTHIIRFSAAGTVAGIVQAYYPSARFPVVVTNDPSNTKLIVEAPASLQSKIATLVEEVDVDPRRDIVQEIHETEHLPAQEATPLLQNALSGTPNTTITHVARTNKIAVLAPSAVQERVRKLLDTLDQPPPVGEEIVQKNYKIRHTAASNLVGIVQQHYPVQRFSVTVTSDPSNTVLMVGAPASLQSKIAALVEEADVDPKRDIVQEIYETENLSAQEATPLLQNALSGTPNTTITHVARTNKIAVLAPSAVQERVRKLLDTLDQPPPVGEEIVQKIHNIRYTAASNLVAIVQQNYPPSRFPVVVTNDPSNTVLMVRAPASLQSKIDALVKEADVDPKRDIVQEIYETENLSAQEATPLLQNALSGTPNTTITHVARTNKIAVLAPSAVQERVRKLLDTLDQPPPVGEEMVQKTHKIRYTAASNLVGIVQQYFPPSRFPVAVTNDSSNTVLVVQAPASLQSKIDALVKEVDVDPKRDIVQKTYDPVNVPAPETLLLLQNALSGMPDTTLTLGALKEKIVVVAPPTVHERVAKLLETFDQAPAPGEEIVSETFKILHSDADAIVGILQQYYPPAQHPVTVTRDPSNTMVVVRAPASVERKIDELIKEIDVPSLDEPVDKTYFLSNVKADRLVDPLRVLLGNRSGSRVTAGPNRRSVVVSAPAVDQERVERYLDEIDKVDASREPVQKFYRIRYARASGLAGSLQTLFPNDPDIRITVDSVNNTVVAFADPAAQERIKSVIDEFDKPGVIKPMVSRVFQLEHASADALADGLSRLFGNNSRRATFVPDSRNNSLSVRSIPELATQIAEAVEERDQPRKRPNREVAVIPLYVVDPFDAELTIDSLFEDLDDSERPTVESSFDPAQLIVRGTEEQLKEIRGLLTQMGELLDAAAGANRQGRPGSGRLVRRIRVQRGDPRTVAEAIEKLWPRLRRNPLYLVQRGGRIGGLPMKRLPSLVPDEDQDREPKDKVPAKPEPAPIGIEGIQNLLPGDPNVPVILTPSVNQLLASSQDSEALRMIEELAQSLTEIPDPDQGEFTIFYLENANAPDVAKALDEAFNGRDRSRNRSGPDRSRRSRIERVRVIADEAANALVVRASPVDLLNVKRLIDSLEDSAQLASSAREPKIIELKHQRAADVLEILREAYADYLQPGTGGPLNLPGFAARSRSGDRTTALAIGVDESANRLIVSAPAPLFAEIQQLVTSLEQASSAGARSYRVLTLDSASPLDVRDALEILLDRPTSRNRSSKGSRQRSSGRRGSRRGSRRSRPPGSGSVTDPSEGGRIARTVWRTRRAPSRDAPTRRLHSPVGIAFAHHRIDPSPSVTASSPAPPRPNAIVAPTGARIVRAAYFQPVEKDDASAPDLAAIGGGVEIEALPGLGVVLLIGADEDLDMLAKVVREIERISKERRLDFHLVPLRHAKSAKLASLLDDMYDKILDARGSATSAQEQGEIIPIAVPNALLIAAPAQDLEKLLELTEKLDTPVRPTDGFKLFRLKHAPAERVAALIESSYANRTGDGELAPTIVAEADERSNAVLALGAPRDLEVVAALIEELDVASTDTVDELRVFHLKNTVAEELAPVLEDAIEGSRGGAQAGGPRGRAGKSLKFVLSDSGRRRNVESGILENVRITPNDRANTLIVSAPAQSMELIATLIDHLDAVSEAVAEIEIFELLHSDALTMIRTLQSLFVRSRGAEGQVAIAADAAAASADGSNPLVELNFSVDERTNSILASGSRAQLEVVEAVILRLDGSAIEERKIHVYKLLNAPATDIADSLSEMLRAQTDLQQLQEGESLARLIEREVVVVPEPLSNSLLITASPRFFDKLLELIEQLDTQPPQVVIQVLIVQVDLDNDDEFGVEVGLQDSVLFNRSIPGTAALVPPFTPEGVAITTNSASFPGFNFNNGRQLGNNTSSTNNSLVGGQGLSNLDLGRTSDSLGYGGLVLSASSESVSILLRALSRERRVDVLSRPQIMTLDNQVAFIQVGQQVPLITDSVISNNIGVTNVIEYRDVGIILQVLPKINPDGTVIMRVDPEVSALAPVTDVNSRVEISPDVFARAINTTRAQTTIMARDGQTAIIGGLIRKETETETRKVPFLGDIPILGIPFRFDSERLRKRELIIFLTPHVVRNEAEAQYIKQQEADRISWCLSDVEEVHGSLGLQTEVYLEPVEEPIPQASRKGWPNLLPRSLRRSSTEPTGAIAATAADRQGATVAEAYGPPNPADGAILPAGAVVESGANAYESSPAKRLAARTKRTPERPAAVEKKAKPGRHQRAKRKGLLEWIKNRRSAAN